jgi:hypothetical protein
MYFCFEKKQNKSFNLKQHFLLSELKNQLIVLENPPKLKEELNPKR